MIWNGNFHAVFPFQYPYFVASVSLLKHKVGMTEENRMLLLRTVVTNNGGALTIDSTEKLSSFVGSSILLHTRSVAETI